MKKLLFAGLALLSFSIANAQRFNPFKVDISSGIAIPEGSGAKGGVAFAIEPKYAIISKLAVGFRLEAALTGRGWVSSDGMSASANVAASASYLVTSDYYYTNSLFRPFTGAGTGLFSMASASVEGDTQKGSISTSSSTKFGGMVRSGFEIKHFRFVVEHDFIGKSTQTVTDENGNNVGTVSAKNGYTTIKIGFFIGGGRRRQTVNAKF
ncbi:MAG: hypothetical protein JST68_08405 [Bacteroidetes bacterium]|nr:hypothetical protein [Bacteroidota bacterium]